jgi:hypothetical protein
MGEYAGRVAERGTQSMAWFDLQEEFFRSWESEKLSPGLLEGRERSAWGGIRLP